MIAFMPPTQYRYYVEYIDNEASPKHRSIYIYSTSEITVREILDDYKILLLVSVDQTENIACRPDGLGE